MRLQQLELGQQRSLRLQQLRRTARSHQLLPL